MPGAAVAVDLGLVLAQRAVFLGERLQLGLDLLELLLQSLEARGVIAGGLRAAARDGGRGQQRQGPGGGTVGVVVLGDGYHVQITYAWSR